MIWTGTLKFVFKVWDMQIPQNYFQVQRTLHYPTTLGPPLFI